MSGYYFFMISFKKLLTKILQELIPVEVSLTADNAISSTDHHVCRLIKKGKTVRAYISVGYNDTSNAIPVDTVFFIIPEQYRPKTNITCSANGWLSTGSPRLSYFTIYSETGIVTQRTSSSIAQISGSMEWTI